MTAEKKSAIKYLTVGLVQDIYQTLYKRFLGIDEPIPPFSEVNLHQIENLVLIPQQTFSGSELYPTLESKAAILFYKINKGHIFPNGNKRLSLGILFMFLEENNMQLSITTDEATQKALELANTRAEDFEIVKIELENWIRKNLKDIT